MAAGWVLLYVLFYSQRFKINHFLVQVLIEECTAESDVRPLSWTGL